MKKLGGWIKSHRKPLFITILLLGALTITATVAYKAGQKHPSSLAKSKVPASLFNKDAFKNLPKKSTSNQPAATNPLTTSSGFFRLSGTVQSVGKDTISLKLTNGSVIVLTTKSTTNYYDGKTKKTIRDLTKNTAAMVTGTIGPDGGFTVSSVQKTTKK